MFILLTYLLNLNLGLVHIAVAHMTTVFTIICIYYNYYYHSGIDQVQSQFGSFGLVSGSTSGKIHDKDGVSVRQ
jgi:hypothetical protein